MPRTPRAPAIPAPMTCVGREAPPVEVEEAWVEAAVPAAPDEVAAPVVLEAVEVMVELRNLPVVVELLLNKEPPVPEKTDVVGTAEPAAVMK
jgi:hypothetical protein